MEAEWQVREVLLRCDVFQNWSLYIDRFTRSPLIGWHIIISKVSLAWLAWLGCWHTHGWCSHDMIISAISISLFLSFKDLDWMCSASQKTWIILSQCSWSKFVLLYPHSLFLFLFKGLGHWTLLAIKHDHLRPSTHWQLSLWASGSEEDSPVYSTSTPDLRHLLTVWPSLSGCDRMPVYLMTHLTCSLGNSTTFHRLASWTVIILVPFRPLPGLTIGFESWIWQSNQHIHI